jgi:DNA-binding NtrC family response regulator
MHMQQIRPSVLLVDDDPALAGAIEECLEGAYEFRSVLDAGEARKALRDRRFACILLDLTLPGEDGLSFLRRLREEGDPTPVVVLTASNRAAPAIEALRLGISDYLTKPYDVGELRKAVERAVASAPPGWSPNLFPEIWNGVLAGSPAMREVVEQARTFARTNTRILLLGETGAGKGALARAIHLESGRDGPFVAVNCAALPAPLLEDELFGHARGAFTGADRSTDGLFRAARGGTLFLDEIDGLPVDLQVKVLRAIESGCIRRVGETQDEPVDARILSATNRDLQAAIAAGRFRPDLYFRLAVTEIVVPPLRGRPEDILVLVHRFLSQKAAAAGKKIVAFEPGVMERLQAYAWPGNVRELESEMERVVCRTTTMRFTRDLLSPAVAGAAPATPAVVAKAAGASPREQAKNDGERKTLVETLEQSGWNVTRAAGQLCMSRSTLHRRMSVLGIDRPPRRGKRPA